MTANRHRYRGWDIDNGEWINISQLLVVCNQSEGNEQRLVVQSEGAGQVWHGMGSATYISHENCILMQSTGLCDSEGTEIYIDDVLIYGDFRLNDLKFGDEPWKNMPEGADESEITTVRHTFRVKDTYRELLALQGLIEGNPDVTGVKIIGNRWEHPELLECSQAGE